MGDQERILYFIEQVGPTLPTKVAKTIGTEILLASAFLSDLASQGKVKISSLKIGGSPLYYLPGQEEQLYKFAKDNLNQKDVATLEKLKNQKVLRESTLDLLEKVGLRKIKDFAIPLQVTIKGETQLFWKWYLLTNEEVNIMINEMLSPKKETSKPQPPIEEQPVKQEKPQPLPPAPSTPEPIKQEPKTEKKEEPKQVEEPKKEINVEEQSREQPEEQVVQTPKTKEQTQITLPKPKIERSKTDKLTQLIDTFVQKHDLTLLEDEIVRKNSEHDLIVLVPTVLGKVKCFARLKKKKRCDDGDVSSAYMQAQIKKLPLLFLYTEEISSKAQEMLKSDAFENVMVKKME